MDKPDDSAEMVVPVIAEELHAGVRTVDTGGVRVKKTVHERQEILDQPLMNERVEVRRVVKNEIVAGPLPTRTVDGVVIVPVVEEVLKIEKQFVLKEELHITKRREVRRHEQTVTLKQEQAEIERFDADGNATASPFTAEPARHDARQARPSPAPKPATQRLSPKERVLARESPRRPRKSILE